MVNQSHHITRATKPITGQIRIFTGKQKLMAKSDGNIAKQEPNLGRIEFNKDERSVRSPNPKKGLQLSPSPAIYLPSSPFSSLPLPLPLPTAKPTDREGLSSPYILKTCFGVFYSFIWFFSMFCGRRMEPTVQICPCAPQNQLLTTVAFLISY